MGTRTGFGKNATLSSPADRPRGVLREYTETILVCVIFIVFARGFVVQQSEIPSESMEDTVLIGDYVLVNRFLYASTNLDLERLLLPVREIRRGDVIVFKHPDEPERDYIKRVIGLPGERVEVRNGVAWIDDQPLNEPYVNPLYLAPGYFPPQVVPEGHYFVMGDHRNASSDSRVWGTVPAALIKGRAFLILVSTGAPPPGDEPGKVTLRSLPLRLWNLVFRARLDRALRFVR